MTKPPLYGQQHARRREHPQITSRRALPVRGATPGSYPALATLQAIRTAWRNNGKRAEIMCRRPYRPKAQHAPSDAAPPDCGQTGFYPAPPASSSRRGGVQAEDRLAPQRLKPALAIPGAHPNTVPRPIANARATFLGCMSASFCFTPDPQRLQGDVIKVAAVVLAHDTSKRTHLGYVRTST